MPGATPAACFAIISLALLSSPGCAQPVASHPRLLVTTDALPALGAKAADATQNRFGFSTRSVWDTIEAKADRLAGLPPYSYSVQIPGVGGVVLEEWQYTLSDATPPPHEKSPSYPPWTAMFQEREDSITTRLVHFSFAYLVTGEELYFDKAREIALHLTKWEQWTDASYGGGRLKACLDTGHCTYAMAMFYDWCFDRLSAAERDEVREALIGKGIEPSLAGVDVYPADTNGYAVITTGATLAALAVEPEVPEASEYVAQCIDKIRVSLDKGGKDGGAFEGPMYGTYLMDSFALALDALTSAGTEHDLFEHPYLATMSRYCIGLLAPDTRQIPCFSDGSPGAGFPQTMRILAQRGSTDAAFYLQQIGALEVTGIYDWIRFDESKLNPVQPQWNPSTVFTDIGYASLRDGFNAAAPSLFFKSGPVENNIGHNHYDHNAFVISYSSQWIIPDRGYHNFYIPPKTKFSLGSIGHCTVVLDIDEQYLQDTQVPVPGKDQIKRFGGQIAEFFAGESFDYVQGRAAEAYNTAQSRVLDRFDRSIVYVKPHFFVIRDDLAAPEAHAFNFLLHGDGATEIRQEGEITTVTRTDAQVYGRIAADVPTESTIALYPGAEEYGPFLRVATEPTKSTRFTAFLYPRPHQNPEFIRNSGFEAGMAGWQPRGNEDMPNHQIVEEEPFEGARCARIETSGYYYSDRFALPPGTEVTARAIIRTTELPEGKGATMTLYFWQGGKAFSSKRVGPFAHTDWQEHVATATVPEGTEQVSLALEFFAPGTAWFDRAQIQAQVEVQEPLTPQITALGNDGLDVTLGELRYVVAFGTSETDVTVGPVTTDGDIAVVSIDADGRPLSAFIKTGTFVAWEGQTFLRLPQAGTAEVTLEDGELQAHATWDITPHAPMPADAQVTVGWAPQGARLNGAPAAVAKAEAGWVVSAR